MHRTPAEPNTSARTAVMRAAVCLTLLLGIVPHSSVTHAASGSVGSSCSGSWSNSYGSSGGTQPRTRATTSTADVDCQSVQSAVCTNSSGGCTVSGSIIGDSTVPLSATRDAVGYFPRTFHAVNPNAGKVGGSTIPACC